MNILFTTKFRITNRLLPNFQSSFLALLLLSLCSISCDEFTVSDRPITELDASAVFEEMSTANAALANIYAQIRDYGMLTGKSEGISKEMGLYTDELTWYGNSNQTSAQFFNNTVFSNHATVADWWTNAYSQIYAINALLEGVSASTKLTQVQKEFFIGEAKFARAFVYFYLVQLYGDVPYVTATDYTVNKSVERMEVTLVYEQLITDLEEASILLSEQYVSPTRSLPNSYAAKAFLARVCLNAGKWAEAANNASAVLNNTELYVWETDLNAVFLKESTSTIWQYAGRSATRNTDDGTTFIFNSAPPRSVALTSSLMNSFEVNDLRKSHWIRERSNAESTFYHSYKYKKMGSNTPQTEFTVVIRLAEMHLIRAEARAKQGDIIGAKEDLNIIRARAGLDESTAVTAAAVLEAILHERQVEFFTEFAHRFMDLKRFGALDDALANKPDWNTTDNYLPLPQTELNLNPNLGAQNPGY